jgi:Restriction endonuclease
MIGSLIAVVAAVLVAVLGLFILPVRMLLKRRRVRAGDGREAPASGGSRQKGWSARSVREFAGSLVERGAAKGVFVTTSQFAPAAAGYAERIRPRLILIDGDELTRLMVQYGVGVRVERRIDFCKLDLDYFEEESIVELECANGGPPS